MYRLIRFQATNIIGFMSGLGKKNLTIDLSDMQDKSILVVCGDNASGKFDISVNASNNITVSRMDFFDKDFFAKN